MIRLKNFECVLRDYYKDNYHVNNVSIHPHGQPYLSVSGNSRPKHSLTVIDPFCHINLYLVDIIFAKAVCISIPGGPPELPSPRGQGERTIYSHYKLGAGQLRESSWYGYTDSFGKNDVYQVWVYMAKWVN